MNSQAYSRYTWFRYGYCLCSVFLFLSLILFKKFFLFFFIILFHFLFIVFIVFNEI